MKITADYVAIKQAIASFLSAEWTTPSTEDLGRYYLLATKDYETLVGVKTATLRFEPYFDGFRLVADYQSEGRNVLSTTYLVVPASVESVPGAQKIAELLKGIDKEVDQSYARRLLLSTNN